MFLTKMGKSLYLAVLCLSPCLVSCSGGEPGAGGGADPDFPVVEGWSQVGDILTYDADNLWEYINGAAELFVEFGVQTCRVTDLSYGDLTVTVDLYDMGNPLNAFGVYEREKPGDDVVVPNAVAGVVSAPYQALLVKGSTYAKVNALEGELTEASGLELLEALAAALPGATAPPQEFDLLPEAGKVAGTDGYKPLAFLGQTGLTDCLYAQYSKGGEDSWQGFVVLPSAAASVWSEVSGAWDSVEHNGETVFFTEVPYSGFVGLVRRGERVFGVAEAEDQPQMLARLEGFVE